MPGNASEEAHRVYMHEWIRLGPVYVVEVGQMLAVTILN